MKKRWSLLDALRGLALVNMICYHGLWDLVYLKGMDLPWYESFGAFCWQQGICWTFILLSGFCWSMSRNQLKHGAIVTVCGFVVMAATIAMGPDTAVWFGVLTLQGSAALLTIPMDKLLRRIPPVLGLFLCALLFALTRWVIRGGVGIPGLFTLPLPAGLYRNLFTAYLGFPQYGFYSTDYFPLVPWLFLYWCGYFLYQGTKDHLPDLLKTEVPVLGWMGRHSLTIYLLHQPVLYALTMLF